MLLKKLLIIDDEPDFTALLKANLEDVGDFLVREVNDSSLAVDAALSFEPDLCIVDVVMPGIDGGDVVSKFTAHPKLKDMKVMMLTALVEENPATADGETMNCGLPFVSKTSEFNVILSCIRKHLAEGPTSQTASV